MMSRLVYVDRRSVRRVSEGKLNMMRARHPRDHTPWFDLNHANWLCVRCTSRWTRSKRTRPPKSAWSCGRTERRGYHSTQIQVWSHQGVERNRVLRRWTYYQMAGHLHLLHHLLRLVVVILLDLVDGRYDRTSRIDIV
jgi:hypothetical protein